jgi:hypothetical protein
LDNPTIIPKILGPGGGVEVVTKEIIQQVPRTIVAIDKQFTKLPSKDGQWSNLQDVTNIQFMKLTNSSPQELRGLKGGADPQHLTILGDGFTTIKHNFAVVNPYEPIFTNVGGDKTTQANKVYRFTRFLNTGSTKLGAWYEDA